MTQRSVVLYAVGSPLVADVEETCRRLGLRIAAGVRNFDGPHFLLDAANLRELADVDAALLRIPCFVPLFTPAHRHKAVREAVARGFAPSPALVDPTAVIAASTTFGAGSYVNAGAVIGAAGRFGEYVIVNRAVSIGHHAEIGDFVSIGPGAVLAGGPRVGRGAMIGAGAIVLPSIEIAAGAAVAAGSVVSRNVAAGTLVGGNPARVVRSDLPLLADHVSEEAE
jgi:UDP-3-O-[3-hydroxymyristoyl] glucosamine N-acyltransferase